jgi:hypothetical protein
MSEAVFELEGATARASQWAAGPWDPTLQHGGAPSALVAWAAGQVATPTPMRIARLTVDLLRPGPIGEIAVQTEVVRQGRKIQLLEVRLLARGVLVARGSVLKIREDHLDLPPGVEAPPLDLPGPEFLERGPPSNPAAQAFGGCFEMRPARGGFRQPGPAAVWFKLERALIAGQPTSPAMRAAAIADFANGLSSMLEFTRWTFLNGDLSVHFARQPVGEWILSNAETWIGHDGAGLAMTRLADTEGYFGRAVQSLVIEARS